MQVNTQVHLIFHLSIYLCHTIFIMCLHCRCNRYHSSFCLAECLVEVRASDRTHLDISRIGNWKKIIAFASFDEHDFVFPVKWFLERRGILVKVWCDPNTIQFIPYLRRFATTHHRSIAILSMYPDLVGWQRAFIKHLVCLHRVIIDFLLAFIVCAIVGLHRMSSGFRFRME